MSIVLDGTTGITTPGLTNTGTETIVNLTTSGNTILGDASTDTLNVGNGGLVKDASGNVGIGTVSPSAKFQVAGDVRINTVGTATTGLPIYAKQTNNDQRGIWTESATTDSNGRFYCDNSVVGIAASYSTTGSYLPITFTTSATERARIDSSGNLLVGQTASGGNQAAGGIVLRNPASGSGGSSVLISHATGVGSGNSFAEFSYNGSGIGNIIQNGTTAVSYNTNSDYRLKENVQPMSGALAKVAALKPVTYKWKANGSDGQGFIAHELQEVVPECVVGEKDAVDADGNPKYQGIDTSFLVATLTAAIQELKALVDTQASTITTLTDRITALEAK